MSPRGAVGAVPIAWVALAGCGATPSGPDDQDIPLICETSNTMSLQVGEAAELTGRDARFFCARTESADAEFVLVAFVAATDDLRVTVLTGGTGPIQGPPLPASPLTAAPASHELSALRGGLYDGLMPDDRFHAELRTRESRELGPLVGAPGGPTARDAYSLQAPVLVVPSVGDFVALNAQSSSACSNALMVTGRVAAVSQKAVVIADTGNPTGGFTDADYQQYAATFDTLIAPIADQNFGAVTDIDGNQRTILFFTKEVNRRTPDGSATFTAGFFFSRDLFPKQTSADGRLSGCETSNEAEILYLMVPDPDGQINNNERSRDFVERLTLSTIIHEDQHLVNAARRLHVQKLGGSDWNEEAWLNEGLAHAAEELLFFRASGFLPGQNITYAALNAAGSKALTAFNRHQSFNLLRFHEHLERPATSSVFSPTDGLPTRGAAWSFVRYAADRRGGIQSDFFYSLVNAPTRGMTNLGGSVGGVATLFEWMSDWGVALYADDRVPGLPVRYQERSWNHPNLYAALEGAGSSYPVQTISLVEGTPRGQQLIGGGTAYFRLGVAAGQEGQVEITSEGKTPPETLKVTLLRTR